MLNTFDFGFLLLAISGLPIAFRFASMGFIGIFLIRRIIRIDATNIAIEELSRPNAVLLGTLTTAVPFLDAGIVLHALTEKFARRNPQAAAAAPMQEPAGGTL